MRNGLPFPEHHRVNSHASRVPVPQKGWMDFYPDFLSFAMCRFALLYLSVLISVYNRMIYGTFTKYRFKDSNSVH